MSDIFSLEMGLSSISGQDDFFSAQTNIKVVGVGGAGCSTMEDLIAQDLKGVEFIAMDTDPQVLNSSTAPLKLQLGKLMAGTIGTGSPEHIGSCAAADSYNEIKKLLQGAQLVILVVGLGGDTGAGAAPIIAEIARDIGALTIAVAQRAYPDYFAKLVKNVDSLIISDGEKLGEGQDKATSNSDSERLRALSCKAVTAVVNAITADGYINLDLDDFRESICGDGYTVMGCGEGKGANFVKDAVQDALGSLSLDPKAATGLLAVAQVNPLFSIVGAAQLTDEFQQYVREDIVGRIGLIIDGQLAKDQIVVTIFLAGH